MIYEKIKKTVKHTLLFGIGSVVNSAFGLVLVPLYARHLKANEFGVLALLTVTLTLITIVLKFGLNHAFFRHYYESEDPRHRRRIVGSTLIFLLTSAALFTSLLYWLAPQVSMLVFSGNAARARLLQLIFLTAFFEIITVVPDSILRAQFRSARYSGLSVAAFVFQLAAIIYLVIGVDSTVENVLLGKLAGTIFEAALFFFVVRRELSLSFSLGELRGLLAFGVPLIFNQISFTLFIMIDRFFLERYTTDRDVGVYAISNTLVSVVTVLATVPFSQVWTVMRFSVMNEEGAGEYYSRVLTYILYVSLFLALGVAAVAGDGLLLYGLKSYWPATQIIPLLALGAVFDSASRVLNVGITLRKRTVYAPLVTVAALGVNIGLNFLLIPRYRVMGATVATLISYAVFCALRYWASNLFFKVRYEWGRVFAMLGVGVALLGAFYAIDWLRGDVKAMAYEDPARKLMLWGTLLGKAALAVSFPLALWAIGFYDERERRRIGELWGRAAAELKGAATRKQVGRAASLLVAAAAVVVLILAIFNRSHG